MQRTSAFVTVSERRLQRSARAMVRKYIFVCDFRSGDSLFVDWKFGLVDWDNKGRGVEVVAGRP